MNDPNDTDIMQEFTKLADAIDRQRYPGAAWVRPRRSRRMLIGLSAGILAAAACILITIAVTMHFIDRQGQTDGTTVTTRDAGAGNTTTVPQNDTNASSTAVAAVRQDSTANDIVQNPWSISPNVSITTSSVQAGIPSISMPSLSEIQWAIPTSLTTEQPERNTNDDKKDSNFDSSLPGGSSICGGVLRHRPDVG